MLEQILLVGRINMDAEMKLMVNTIIEEMGRMEERLNQNLEKVDMRFDKIDQLESRIEELVKRTA